MSLNQLPTVKLSDNNVFLIAISIAAFIFFFTRLERIEGGTSM